MITRMSPNVTGRSSVPVVIAGRPVVGLWVRAVVASCTVSSPLGGVTGMIAMGSNGAGMVVCAVHPMSLWSIDVPKPIYVQTEGVPLVENCRQLATQVNLSFG